MVQAQKSHEYTNIHVYVYVYIYIDRYTYVNLYMYAYIPTHKRVMVHVQTSQIYMCICIYIHISIKIYIYVHTYIQNIHTTIQIYMSTFKYIYTHKQTSNHTRTRVIVHTRNFTPLRHYFPCIMAHLQMRHGHIHVSIYMGHIYNAITCFLHHMVLSNERWGAGVETQENVREEIGGWGRVPYNEPYAPLLSTIYDGA